MAITQWVLLAAFAGTMSVGCADSGASSEQGVTQADSSLLAAGTSFLYFRSNATGWGVDETNRVKPWVAPNVYVTTFNVTEPWMLTGTDTATFVETDQQDGWGSSQTFHKAQGSAPVATATAYSMLATPSGDPHFQVHYDVLGLHRVLVNMNMEPPQFIIESAGQVCANLHCPSNLHCEMPSNGVPTCIVNPGTCGSVVCPTTP